MAAVWDFIRSWLTLPVVFVLVNVVIGTIAVTSAWRNRKNPNANGRPSALARLMSAGSFCRRTPTVDDDAPWSSFPTQDGHVQRPRDRAEPPEERELQNPLEDIQAVPESQAGGIEPGTSRGDVRPVPESEAVGVEPRTLTRRAPRAARLGKSKSDSPTGSSPGELLPPPPPPGIKKSGSFDSIFGGTGANPPDLAVKPEDVAPAAEVDAQAEDFIQRFKNQLKLQRLQSILRYKEMIDRGK